ncbi:hypothetical protein BURCENK562V_C4850 [Burkholderia cenocepacia K56-2Valvano]|nr:hypothetical protein BURCENK562V_C4850 [Burkholderia cenocepacia K56-2Valvano]
MPRRPAREGRRSVTKGAHCRRDGAKPEHSLAKVWLAKFYLGKCAGGLLAARMWVCGMSSRPGRRGA